MCVDIAKSFEITFEQSVDLVKFMTNLKTDKKREIRSLIRGKKTRTHNAMNWMKIFKKGKLKIKKLKNNLNLKFKN